MSLSPEVRLARVVYRSQYLCLGLLLCWLSTGCRRATPDVTHRQEQISDGPFSIQLVEVNLTNASVILHTASARDTTNRLATLSQQLRSLPRHLGRPLAAVNGDFFRFESGPYSGDPRGLQIRNFELISAPSGDPCLYIDETGRPRLSNVVSSFLVRWPNGYTLPIGLNEECRPGHVVLFTRAGGPTTLATNAALECELECLAPDPPLPLRADTTYRVRVRAIHQNGNTVISTNLVLSFSRAALSNAPSLTPGSLLELVTETSATLDRVRTAIGGGPVLVANGRSVAPQASVNRTNAAAAYRERSMYERHPRTAVAWSENRLWLVQVDGRQPGYSTGMTLAELAQYLVKLGAREALNLDGGGSSTLWYRGKVRNRPCDGEERAMANSLVLVQNGHKPR